jgi:hypothetical protein
MFTDDTVIEVHLPILSFQLKTKFETFVLNITTIDNKVRLYQLSTRIGALTSNQSFVVFLYQSKATFLSGCSRNEHQNLSQAVRTSPM